MSEEQQVLGETFTQVLERHAFMFADLDSGVDLEAGEADYFQLAIHFKGPVRGRLDLEAPEGLGKALAANILGVEPEDEIAATQAQDALMELLNILCGQVLTTLYGTASVFELSLPTACRVDRAVQKSRRQRHGGVSLLIDGTTPAWAYLSVEGTEQ